LTYAIIGLLVFFAVAFWLWRKPAVKRAKAITIVSVVVVIVAFATIMFGDRMVTQPYIRSLESRIHNLEAR